MPPSNLWVMSIAAHRDDSPPDPARRLPIGPFTWDDVQNFPPEDGVRYELLDGVLVVSPGVSKFHWRITKNLANLLNEAGAGRFEAVGPPFDWYINEYRYFEPDLLVIPMSDENTRRFEGVPLLAVEILSEFSRPRDLGFKKTLYAEAGLEWYWVVDPDVADLTVFRLAGARYVDHAHVVGSQAYETEQPAPVRVVPADLLNP